MKILYFASLRESLNRAYQVGDYEQIELKNTMTIIDLKAKLKAKYGAEHFPKNTICALNFELADDLQTLKNTDEVAFYPPVTGG